MKYIIMCGGDYECWETPKQLFLFRGEPIVARTIRLLKECGVEDIAISSNNPIFEQFDVPVLHHKNDWKVYGYERAIGSWCNGFYPTDYPVCYLLGDVVFSKAAIKKIVETDTQDIEFFASAPPFAMNYPKEYAEPFAFKVVNTKYFRECINKVLEYEQQGLFERHPIAWELWQVIRCTPINHINYRNYTVINDFTCDIDWETEVKYLDFIGED